LAFWEIHFCDFGHSGNWIRAIGFKKLTFGISDFGNLDFEYGTSKIKFGILVGLFLYVRKFFAYGPDTVLEESNLN